MAGSAWTNQPIITSLVIIEGTGNNVGLFVYNGTPGLGTLIGSWTPTAGTDPYGNPYPQGFSATQGIFQGTIQAGSIVNTPIGGSTITNSDWQQGTMEETTITFDTAGGQLLVYGTTTGTTTFTSGSGTWTAPSGVTSVKAECWGGGAGGGIGQFTSAGGGPGGGGGEYSCEPKLAVTPASNYAYSVGAGGTAGIIGGTAAGNGTATTMAGNSVTVTANGGKHGDFSAQTGGAGGQGSSNSIHFSGGTGGDANGNGGAGGGSSAGTSANGGTGASTSGATGGAGGTAPSGGGNGGAGGSNNQNGVAGTAPGGAGGGGHGGTVNQENGGAGAAGQVKLTWVTTRTLIAAVSAAAGTDSAGNKYPQSISGIDSSGNWVALGQGDAKLWYGAAGAAGTVNLASANNTLTGTTLGGQAGSVPITGLATFPGTTVAQAVLTTIASATYLANDAVAGAIYELEVNGNGTQGSTQQTLQFQVTFGGTALTSFTLGSAFMPISQAFRWKVRARVICHTSGVGGTWSSELESTFSAFSINLLPANSANSTGAAVSCESTGTTSVSTASNQTLALQCAWGSITGTPTLTSRVASFKRIA